MVLKQEQNGSVNGNHLKSIVDPYDELIKNHLRNEEKVKVKIIKLYTTDQGLILLNPGGFIILHSFILLELPYSLIIHVWV